MYFLQISFWFYFVSPLRMRSPQFLLQLVQHIVLRVYRYPDFISFSSLRCTNRYFIVCPMSSFFMRFSQIPELLEPAPFIRCESRYLTKLVHNGRFKQRQERPSHTINRETDSARSCRIHVLSPNPSTSERRNVTAGSTYQHDHHHYMFSKQVFM